MTSQSDTTRFNHALITSICCIAVLASIHAGSTAAGVDLWQYGLLPRDPGHLYGIFTAPLIHGSWSHLATNGTALLVLLSATLYGYPRASRYVIPLIWIGSGAGVWLFARESFHVGASGLTCGLMFFTFSSGVLRRDPRSSALSMLVFFLYGGMLWGIFPRQPDISFEYHFFGALSGVSGAVLLCRLDPPPTPRRYSWEGTDEPVDPANAWWLAQQDDSDPPRT